MILSHSSIHLITVLFTTQTKTESVSRNDVVSLILLSDE